MAVALVLLSSEMEEPLLRTWEVKMQTLGAPLGRSPAVE